MAFASCQQAAPEAPAAQADTVEATEPPIAVDTTGPFVVLTDLDPTIVVDLRYHGSNNFVAAPLDGYQQPLAILTREAAHALCRISDSLRRSGLALKVFDAYRPLRAVRHMQRWAASPSDTLAKRAFYPRQDKRTLFANGYVSSRSKHCHGSTVDLTLVTLATGQELDMGTPFDLMDLRSHYSAADLTPLQRSNRKRLREIMRWGGFRPIENEWWHFVLRDEPYSQSFDVPVNRDSLALFGAAISSR